MQAMSYQAGDEVLVLAINRKGRIVERVGARYRVIVGALTTTCGEDEIRPVDSGCRDRRRARRSIRSTPPVEQTPVTSRLVRSIDLHGMTVEEAEAAVLAFVNDALLDEADTLEIIHGVGTGRVRRAAIAQLRGISAVKAVRPHPANRGVTIVHL